MRQFPHYAIHSLAVEEGSCFFALAGQKVDGHLFLKEVASRGAACAVVKESYQGPNYGLELFRVKDPLMELQSQAQKKVPLMGGKIVGITGSYSKTTMKEYLSSLLSSESRVFKSPGNQNSQAGLPLALLNAKGEYDFLILEMGAHMPGQLIRLAQMAPPRVAIMTGLAEAHLAHLKSLEGIAKEKSHLVMEGVTERVYIHKTALPYVHFFEKRGVKIFPYPNQTHPVIFGDTFDGALEVASFLGVGYNEIPYDRLKREPYRYEERDCGFYRLILDCYNANPTTAIDFYQRARAGWEGRVIGVFGQMEELGEKSDLYHKQVIEQIASSVDLLFLYGERIRTLLPFLQETVQSSSLSWFPNHFELKKKIEETLTKGDLLLVKGANSNRLWELFDGV